MKTPTVRPPLRKPPYRVARALLPNGLRLLTIETPHLHTAAICLYVRAGSRYETRRRRTACRTSSSTCCFAARPATRARSRSTWRSRSWAARSTPRPGRDYSLYQIALHPKQVARGLEILGDLFATPTFRDIDLERKIIVEEILEDLDDRGRNINVDDQSRQLAWDDHPLGFPITGPLRNVGASRLGDVRAHFRRFYGAANMVLAVAGPLSPRRGACGTRGRRSRACRAARGAGRARRGRPAAGRASAPCTTNRRRRRSTSCFTRSPRPIRATWRCAR